MLGSNGRNRLCSVLLGGIDANAVERFGQRCEEFHCASLGNAGGSRNPAAAPRERS